jgi:hypothetical protein
MFAGLLPGNGAGTNPSVPFFLVALYKKGRPGTPVGRVRNQGETMAAEFEAFEIESPSLLVLQVLLWHREPYLLPQGPAYHIFSSFHR